jgi:hypothetical protein
MHRVKMTWKGASLFRYRGSLLPFVMAFAGLVLVGPVDAQNPVAVQQEPTADQPKTSAPVPKTQKPSERDEPIPPPGGEAWKEQARKRNRHHQRPHF